MKNTHSTSRDRYHFFIADNCCRGSAVVAWFVKASVFHSGNSAPSANGGPNLPWVCYTDRSEVETLCRNSNCRAPGAAMPLPYMPQALAVNLTT